MTRQLQDIQCTGLRVSAQGRTMRSSLPRWCLTALAASLAAVLAPPINAATLLWTGSSGSASWSDLANWNFGRAPLDGDDVVFGGTAAWLDNALDYSLTLGSFTFAAAAQSFRVHVAGNGGHMLAFDGLGIQNFTAGTGPIRQQLFADAGLTGGTILFKNSASVNLGTANYRPVDITAVGGTWAGALGGQIVFQDVSNPGDTTFTGLIVEGASVAGAGAGSLTFRDTSFATSTTRIGVRGGTALGAAGGQATFQNSAQAHGNITLGAGAGVDGGLGGKLTFRGHAFAGATAVIFNGGAVSQPAGNEAVTRFQDDTRLAGSVLNGAGSASGVNGGRLEFHDRALFDSAGLDPSLGSLLIYNYGSAVNGAQGGSTVFHGDTGTRGALLVINNATEGESTTPGSAGGTTEFRDHARAGQVTIYNHGAGAGAPGTLGGRTSFFNNSSAEVALIVSRGGSTEFSAPGGSVQFRDDASAASATFQNLGGNGALTRGGQAQFFDRTTAAMASIVNSGGVVAGAFGGALEFAHSASAGNSAITNAPGDVPGAFGGSTRFANTTTAGTAFIGNLAALGASGMVGAAGSTSFVDAASADRATLVNQGGIVGNTFDAGSTNFFNLATAANATISNLGSRGGGAGYGGVTHFYNHATAAAAVITNFGTPGDFAYPGTTGFHDDASAAAASIVNAGGSGNTGLGGITYFLGNASAGAASILNAQATAAGGNGGRTAFFDSSTAGSATITAQGTSIAQRVGGLIIFDGGSGGNATLIAEGATGADGVGGLMSFDSSSTAGNATLIARSAAVAGAGGGQILIRGTGSGGTAAAVLQAGAVLDISGVSFAPGYTTLGSVEGAGTVRLGGRVLQVGLNNRDTEFSGSLVDGGQAGGAAGTLVKAGTGVLTLSGVNTYTGGTASDGGQLVVLNNTGAGLGSGLVNVKGNSELVFKQQALAGGNFVIVNSALSTRGAVVRFTDTASAGIGQFQLVGGSSSDPVKNAKVLFDGDASAGSAAFRIEGGTALSAYGNELRFAGNANAGSARFDNFGGNAGGGGGGFIAFDSAGSSAGSAGFNNLGGAVSNIGGRLTFFAGTAANATITNGPATGMNGSGGRTSFSGLAGAGAATILNTGGTVFGGNGGFTVFSGSSSAGSANITNLSGAASSAFGGDTGFIDEANAGRATFMLQGAQLANAQPGLLVFSNSSNAADARFTMAGGSVVGGRGGQVIFFVASSAGRAAFQIQGGTAAGALGGDTSFTAGTTAGSAVISTAAAPVLGAKGGQVSFNAASAGTATFTNQGSSLAGTGDADTARVVFLTTATAANAVFFNQGGTVAGALGGETDFYANATAGNGVFHNHGGAVNGAGSGQTLFYGSATAGAATLYAHPSAVSAAGGGIVFLDSSSGGTARAIVEGNATSSGGLDISLHAGTGMSIGSIEGGGTISLGNKALRVGINDRDTTFSGLIRDGGFNPATGGSLFVNGAGALTLSGANTYSGATQIGNGATANSGKLNVTNTSGSATGSGPVFVNRGGTLGGSGFTAGPVTLRAGGVIAPGDPVTLTLLSSLSWDGGGVIRLVLGADTAGSDQLFMDALIRGADGAFLIDLVNAGTVVGETYQLIHFNSVIGFVASDFSYGGVAGSFSLSSGTLGFTAAVPEPGASGLMLVGLLMLARVLRVRQGRSAAANSFLTTQSRSAT